MKIVLTNMQNYSTPEESYSPMFSTIGLQTDELLPGVQSLYFHYNRCTRILWKNLISVEMKLNKKLSTPQHIVFGQSEGMLAFYDTDAFIFESSVAKKAELFLNRGENVSDIWTEYESENRIIFRGYSENGDDRDPDKKVPFIVGVRVIEGKAEKNEESVTVYADNDGKIKLAFAFSALEFTLGGLNKKLDDSPESCDEAKKICEDWISDCIGDYIIPKDTEEKNLVEKAIHSLTFNMTKGQGNLEGYVSAFPNRGTYPTHFLWDSCFQNLAYERMNVKIAEDSLLLLVKNQRFDGKFPQFACSTWIRPLDTQPALIGWATLRLVKLTGNKMFAEKMLGAIEKNNVWWLTQRATKSGLLSCSDGLETGQDDSPRFDNGEIIACDMNSYLLNQMKATAELCEILSLKSKAEYWKEKSEDFAEKMTEVLYDEEKNIFLEVRCENGEKSPLISASSLLPLWAGAKIERERAEKMIENYLLNEQYLFGEVPFPSIAYNQPSYNAGQWWRGPTWLPIAWLMLETLEKYGYEKEKYIAAERLYNVIAKDKEMHELFNSKTGEGLGSVEQGWSCSIFLRLHSMLKKS